jgi:ATP-dependent Clp protease ATP-binding subunit ClpC
MGALDPIIGRELEIERVSQILSRRKKNNPILIGEPVLVRRHRRRTCIAHCSTQSFKSIVDKRVVSLDLAALVAGTKYRGQFEERMKAIMNELEKNRDVILLLMSCILS